MTMDRRCNLSSAVEVGVCFQWVTYGKLCIVFKSTRMKDMNQTTSSICKKKVAFELECTNCVAILQIFLISLSDVGF